MAASHHRPARQERRGRRRRRPHHRRGHAHRRARRLPRLGRGRLWPGRRHARLRQCPQPSRVHELSRHVRRRAVRRLDHQPDRRQGLTHARRVPVERPSGGPRGALVGGHHDRRHDLHRRDPHRLSRSRPARRGLPRGLRHRRQASRRDHGRPGRAARQGADPGQLAPRDRHRPARALHGLESPLPEPRGLCPRASHEGRQPRRRKQGRGHLHPLGLGQVRPRLSREDGLGAHAHPALRREPHQVPAAVGRLRRQLPRRALRARRHRRHPHPQGQERLRGPLPQEQRQDRLRHCPAARPAAPGRARRLWHRQPGGEQHHGHVRRDAHRAVPASRRRARRRRAERRAVHPHRYARRGRSAGPGRPRRLARPGQAGRSHRRRRLELALHSDRRPLLGAGLRRQPGRRPVHLRGRRGALRGWRISRDSTPTPSAPRAARCAAKLQSRVAEGRVRVGAAESGWWHNPPATDQRES